MSNQQNLRYTQGDRFDRIITYTSPDGSSPSISGAVLYFTIKASESDTDEGALLQLRSDQASLSGSLTPLDATSARVVILPAAGAALPPGNHHFDTQAVFSAEDVSTGCKGRFRVNSQITRSA